MNHPHRFNKTLPKKTQDKCRQNRSHRQHIHAHKTKRHKYKHTHTCKHKNMKIFKHNKIYITQIQD